DDVDHLAGPLRARPDVDAGVPGVEVRGEKGVDRVGLPAPFADLLEQARAHPATERDGHEMRRVAVRVELRDARGPETEMHLLEVLLVDRQSGTRIRGAPARRRPAAGAV